jgi:5-carboxymethyl-2-hydroxymuconate isomerase
MVPHLSIEYSAGLEGDVDLNALCVELLQAALNTGLFELGALRVRAFRADAYAIADQLPENNFLDISLRMGQGRDEASKKQLGEALFSTAETFLAPLFEASHFALSLEIREIDAQLSWKKNAIHTRLR